MLQHFKCDSCDFYLTPPVTQCTGGHNLCNQCSVIRCDCVICHKVFRPWVIRIIGYVGNRLSFPCPYDTNGCTIISKWTELNDHRKRCDFRNYDCPLDSPTCDWSGPVIRLQEHFQEVHFTDDNVHFARNGTVKFDVVHLSDPYHKISPIFVFHKVFLMHMIRTNRTNCTKVYVQYLGVKKDADLFEYHFVLKNSNGTKCVFKGPVTYYAPETVDQISKQVIIDDCQMLDAAHLLLKIKQRDEIHINEPLLKRIECPICTEYMSSPIFQCEAGHSLCNKCTPKVTRCPTCNALMGRQRNFGLESVTEDILAPCAFATDGCTEVADVNKIKEHEAECTYGNFKCEKLNCTWRGKLNEMLRHVESVHGKFSIGKNKWINVKNSDGVKEIVEAHGQPFCFIIRLVDGYYHFLVRGYYEHSKFVYTIKISHNDNIRYVGLSDECANHRVSLRSAVASGITHILTIANVKSFLDDNGDLNYSLNIQKCEE